MQIVHAVRQFYPSVGGLEEVVRALAVSQVEKGHSVRVVTLDRVFGSEDRLPAKEILDGIEVVRIPFRGSTRYPIAFGAIRHVGDADIVHVHGIDFLFDYLAWTVLFHRRRLVVSTHGGYFHTPYASKLKRLYFPTMTRASLCSYAGVAAVSTADDDLFRKIRSKGLSLIENGVNVSRYADAGASTPQQCMIAIGRFSLNKRLDRVIALLAAIKRIDPTWRLKVAGRPSDLDASDIQNMARDAGVGGSVEIAISPTEDDIRGMMSDCSVVVSGSDYEGFGLTAVEGLSAGLIPVLSDIPPFRRLVEQTDRGMVLDFSDPDRAADEFLTRWASIEPNYEVHRRAAIAASANYSWEHVSKDYEELYHSVLGINVRSILDVGVDAMTVPEAVERLDERSQDPSPDMVFFANAHTLNQAMRDKRTRQALQRATVLNDGVGLDIASRVLFGSRFPANLNGTDFIPTYLKQTQHRYRLFLLGSKPGVAERAADRLMKIAPQHEIAGCHHGYVDAEETASLVETIRRSNADVLLVAMGNPQQELWLMEHLSETGCRLGIGVGALFDFLAEVVPRAPAWMRKTRLEWAYRMLKEPGRLWRRYLVGMPVFLLRVGRQWMAGARVSRVLE